MKIMPLIILSTTLLLLLSGCKTMTPPPVTLDNFYGECNMPFGRDLCDFDNEICTTYQQVLLTQYGSFKDCSRACDNIQLSFKYQVCADTIDQGAELCERYCRMTYGE